MILGEQWSIRLAGDRLTVLDEAGMAVARVGRLTERNLSVAALVAMAPQLLAVLEASIPVLFEAHAEAIEQRLPDVIQGQRRDLLRDSIRIFEILEELEKGDNDSEKD